MTNPSALSRGDSPEYIDAILGYLGDRDPLEVFGKTSDALQRAVENLSDDEVRRKPAPDKWSVLEVVQHLADAELTLAFRYRKVIAEDAPDIPYIEQDDWADNLGYNAYSLADAIGDFNALRAMNLRLFSPGLAEQFTDRRDCHARPSSTCHPAR